MKAIVIRYLCSIVGIASAAGFLASPALAENWPMWRGPRGDGTSSETHVPLHFSATKNIAWKVEVPGLGHSSPIVWGDRIFLETCLTDSQERAILAYDRRTGRELWRRSVLKAPLEAKHTLNSFASSTPATDGELIYASFLDVDRMLVAAYDFAGRQVWNVHPGVFSSRHGYCSSPILFEDMVIVNGDHDGDAYLVALDRSSGKTLWKVDRENKTRSYCTPIVRTFGGRPQMILSGSKSVASFDPRSGDRLWVMDGPTEQFVASMVDNGKLVFLTAGFPDKHILAIRPDGSGHIGDEHIAWRTTENCAYVPSPVIVGDYFLVVADNGIASCYRAADGRRMWKERMGRHYSASLVAAEGLAFFLSDDGIMTVVRPGPKYDVVARSELGEACYASPAISSRQLLIRAEKHLYAVGAPDAARVIDKKTSR